MDKECFFKHLKAFSQSKPGFSSKDICRTTGTLRRITWHHPMRADILMDVLNKQEKKPS
jgi:hypothetical protein